MKDEVKKEGSRLGYGIEVVLLTAVFVIVCTVLLEGFAASVKVSQNAKDLCRSTDICRNAAEIYISNGDIEKTAKALSATPQNGCFKVYFDKDLSTCDESQKVYMLVITEKESETKGVSKVLFTVYHGETEVYSLETGTTSGDYTGGAG